MGKSVDPKTGQSLTKTTKQLYFLHQLFPWINKWQCFDRIHVHMECGINIKACIKLVEPTLVIVTCHLLPTAAKQAHVSLQR